MGAKLAWELTIHSGHGFDFGVHLTESPTSNLNGIPTFLKMSELWFRSIRFSMEYRSNRCGPDRAFQIHFSGSPKLKTINSIV